MRVKFASLVSRVEANAGLVHEPSQLNVPRRFNKLNGSESPGGYNASAMARLGAVGHDNGFDVADQAIWSRGTPKAKVFNRVNKHGLTL